MALRAVAAFSRKNMDNPRELLDQTAAPKSRRQWLLPARLADRLSARAESEGVKESTLAFALIEAGLNRLDLEDQEPAA